MSKKIIESYEEFINKSSEEPVNEDLINEKTLEVPISGKIKAGDGFLEKVEQLTGVDVKNAEINDILLGGKRIIIKFNDGSGVSVELKKFVEHNK